RTSVRRPLDRGGGSRATDRSRGARAGAARARAEPQLREAKRRRRPPPPPRPPAPARRADRPRHRRGMDRPPTRAGPGTAPRRGSRARRRDADGEASAPPRPCSQWRRVPRRACASRVEPPPFRVPYAARVARATLAGSALGVLRPLAGLVATVLLA